MPSQSFGLIRESSIAHIIGHQPIGTRNKGDKLKERHVVSRACARVPKPCVAKCVRALSSMMLQTSSDVCIRSSLSANSFEIAERPMRRAMSAAIRPGSRLTPRAQGGCLKRSAASLTRHHEESPLQGCSGMKWPSDVVCQAWSPQKPLPPLTPMLRQY